MSPPITAMLGDHSFSFRPSYAALVAAEDDIGPLFALVERASSGTMKLSEMIAMLWHCRVDMLPDMTRADFAAHCVEAGLAHVTPLFRRLMEQALGGA